jgi:hypothetical protein
LHGETTAELTERDVFKSREEKKKSEALIQGFDCPSHVKKKTYSDPSLAFFAFLSDPLENDVLFCRRAVEDSAFLDML